MNRQRDTIQEIGRRLLDERTRLKLTQHQVAESIGVSAQWYGKVERGHCRTSIEMLVALNQNFGIDLTYLLTGKPAPNADLDRIVSDCPTDKRFHIETILRAAKALYEVSED